MRKQNYIISDRAKDLSVKLERPAEEMDYQPMISHLIVE